MFVVDESGRPERRPAPLDLLLPIWMYATASLLEDLEFTQMVSETQIDALVEVVSLAITRIEAGLAAHAELERNRPGLRFPLPLPLSRDGR